MSKMRSVSNGQHGLAAQLDRRFKIISFNKKELFSVGLFQVWFSLEWCLHASDECDCCLFH